jgi:hypothetical protein
MSFHRPGQYAINMGLDTDNAFRLGGWSAGASVYRLQSYAGGSLRIGGALYPANAASNYLNVVSGLYGGLEIVGTSNGYAGVSFQASSGVAVMYDPSGNGGAYRQATGSWHYYWLQSDGCLALGGSTTAPGYKAYTNGSHYVAGALYATGDITAYSDERIKKDIFTIPDALAKVEALRGVMYVRKDNEKAGTGVIAQEVEKILPEVVVEDHEGMKGVAYGNMVGLLIEAIKELNAKVDSLQAQLDSKG